MKYCPICETRFDEEIIRFCTKDGTPLIEEAAPSFTELPSENIEEDDIGEITVIRRKEIVPPLPPNLDEGLPPVVPPSERIVIPTNQTPAEQTVRQRTTQAYYPPPPPPPNTAKTVILTVLGTVVVLGLGAALFWFLQKDTASNKIQTRITPTSIRISTQISRSIQTLISTRRRITTQITIST